MDRLARDLGVKAVLSQGQWDNLLQVLDTRRIDVVVNGYEWTRSRARDYLATRPYYVFQLQVMAPRGGPIRSWADLQQPKPGGGPLAGGRARRVGGRDLRAGRGPRHTSRSSPSTARPTR